MGLELFLCFLIAVALTGGRSASDIIHAMRGTTPAHLEKARIKAQAEADRRAALTGLNGPVTATTGDVVKAYWGAAMADAIEYAGRAQKNRRTKQNTQPQAQPLAGSGSSTGPAPPEQPTKRPDGWQTPDTTPPQATPTDRPQDTPPPAPVNEDTSGKPTDTTNSDNVPPGTWTVGPNGERIELNPTAPPPDNKHNDNAGTDAGTHNSEENPMTQPNTNTSPAAGMPSEVTGYKSAVAYSKAVAAAHEAHGGAEGYLTSLANMEFGAEHVASAQAAMEASRNAAQLWQQHADNLVNANQAVNEAYMSSPSAASKQANLNE